MLRNLFKIVFFTEGLALLFLELFCLLGIAINIFADEAIRSNWTWENFLFNYYIIKNSLSLIIYLTAYVQENLPQDKLQPSNRITHNNILDEKLPHTETITKPVDFNCRIAKFLLVTTMAISILVYFIIHFELYYFAAFVSGIFALLGMVFGGGLITSLTPDEKNK